jgi:hypothetical protein
VGIIYTLAWLLSADKMQLHTIYPQLNWGISVKQIQLLLLFVGALGFASWYILAALTYWTSKGFKERTMFGEAIRANKEILKGIAAQLLSGEKSIEKLQDRLIGQEKSELREDYAKSHLRLQTTDASIDWARKAASKAAKTETEIKSILKSLRRIRKEMPTLKVTDITEKTFEGCDLSTANPREIATLVGLATIWRTIERLKLISNIPHKTSPKERKITDRIKSLRTMGHLIETVNAEYENKLSQLGEHTLSNLVKRGLWLRGHLD